jgi:hypothetical protein
VKEEAVYGIVKVCLEVGRIMRDSCMCKKHGARKRKERWEWGDKCKAV